MCVVIYKALLIYKVKTGIRMTWCASVDFRVSWVRVWLREVICFIWVKLCFQLKLNHKHTHTYTHTHSVSTHTVHAYKDMHRCLLAHCHSFTQWSVLSVRLVVSLFVKKVIYVLVVRPIWLLCECVRVYVLGRDWSMGVKPQGKVAQQLQEASTRSSLLAFLSIHCPSPFLSRILQ